MEKVTDDQAHVFRVDIEKFTLFLNACLASMKERQSTQEDVCARKTKQIKEERNLIQKLHQYEKHGMDFYTDASTMGFSPESRLMTD